MIRAAVLAVCLALPLAAAAQLQPRDRAADSIDWDKDKDKPESEAQLPPPPQNLIRYDPGRPSSMQFFVDAPSVSLSEDGLVRFTSVARGEGSSANVTFEAIRCTTREYKIYAYGKARRDVEPGARPAVEADPHRPARRTPGDALPELLLSLAQRRDVGRGGRRGGTPRRTSQGRGFQRQRADAALGGTVIDRYRTTGCGSDITRLRRMSLRR